MPMLDVILELVRMAVVGVMFVRSGVGMSVALGAVMVKVAFDQFIGGTGHDLKLRRHVSVSGSITRGLIGTLPNAAQWSTR
jgi:hypothetical protein